MLKRFVDFIAAQHLVPSGGKVLLAVSGGRDSACMANLFHSAGIPFAIAHCNFHLRPVDCDRDQQFVHSLADTYGVPFFTTDFDTRQFASERHLGIEEAARILRYRYFQDLCIEHGFSLVATAHHSDDSIETFFLNLFRGTGIAGLHGILPSSDQGVMTLIRPMLCFSRGDITDYMLRHKLDYVEDVTNSQLDARRNRIRLQLMPLLRELSPSVDSTMLANIERLRQVEQIYSSAIDALCDSLCQPVVSPLGIRYDSYDIEALLRLDPQRTYLFALLQPYNFSAAVVDNIAAALPRARSGTRFFSPTHMAAIDRQHLIVAEYFSPEPPRVEVDAIAATELPYLGFGREERNVEYVDADLVKQPLTVRHWQRGDRFCPLGMSHQRLLSDFLKDAKINVFEKRAVYVLVDADDRIVWVLGLRTDNRFRVTPGTRSALRLTLPR